MPAFLTILLLVFSNAFMTVAWYGHLRFAQYPWGQRLSVFGLILVSWGVAFFEYCLQVPANRIGFQEYGGPFSLIQLKVMQEVITLVVFTIFSLLFFKNESFRLNHVLAFGCLIMAVYLVFTD